MIYLHWLIFAFLFLISPPSFSKDLKIAALFWSPTIDGQVIMRQGLEAEFEKLKKDYGLSIEMESFLAGDGPQGVRKQIVQMENAVQKKYDLIIIQPTDNAALVDPLKAANLAKIPVIAFDQYIIGGTLHSYITSNNFQAGLQNGYYIANLFPNDFTIRIILVDYPNISSTVERVDGFITGLKRSKQPYKILRSYQAVEPVGGKKVAKSIVNDFPKGSFDVLFTVNNGGGIPIVNELFLEGYDIKVATVDGDPISVNNIKNNKLTVINSAQFCAELGRATIQTAFKLLAGEKYPKKVLIPTFPIIKDTLNIYPGWTGEVPPSFPLTWLSEGVWNNKRKLFWK